MTKMTIAMAVFLWVTGVMPAAEGSKKEGSKKDRHHRVSVP